MAACTDTSSADVGSSQTTIAGPPPNARAIATRCLRPPDSWRGRKRQVPFLEPDRADQVGESLAERGAGQPGQPGQRPG